eukprot:767408-Hanusia_phi.AAC.6
MREGGKGGGAGGGGGGGRRDHGMQFEVSSLYDMKYARRCAKNRIQFVGHRYSCTFAVLLALANLGTTCCFLGYEAIHLRLSHAQTRYSAYSGRLSTCQMTVKFHPEAMNPLKGLGGKGKLRMPAIKEPPHISTDRVNLGGADIELCRLVELVEAKGGADEVTLKKQWGTLARELGLDTKILRNISSRLKVAYLSLVMSQNCSGNRNIAAPETLGQEKGKDLIQLAQKDSRYRSDREQVKSQDKASKRTSSVATKKSKVLLVRNISGSVALPDEVEDDVVAIATQYLADEIGVEKKNIDKILESCPQLQGLSVRDNLRPTVKFLVKEVGIGIEKMRKIIVSFPQLLGLSIKENLRPTVRYLVEEVGISQEKLNKTIVTHPQLLAYSIDNNLRPKLVLLQQHADIPKERLADVITRCPHVLGYSEGHILAFIKFLSEELGIERSKLARIITYSPQLIGLSVESNLRPKAMWKTTCVRSSCTSPNISFASPCAALAVPSSSARSFSATAWRSVSNRGTCSLPSDACSCCGSKGLTGCVLQERTPSRTVKDASSYGRRVPEDSKDARRAATGASLSFLPPPTFLLLLLPDFILQEEIRSSREAAKSIRSSVQLNAGRQPSSASSEIIDLLLKEFPSGSVQGLRAGRGRKEDASATGLRALARKSRAQGISGARAQEGTRVADPRAMEIYIELSNDARKVRAMIKRQLQVLELSVHKIKSSSPGRSRSIARSLPACEVRLSDQGASDVIRQYCDEMWREEGGGGGGGGSAPVYYWHSAHEQGR